MSPRNAVTVLDTHDGIGVIDVGPDRKSPDGLPGCCPPEEIDGLVETIHQRSNGESRQATGAAASNLDLYQVNCTFYDALGRRDDDYLIARAIQFFAPGVPQVYYVGLLAGTNDLDLLRRTGVGRDINRHYYTQAELHERLEAPVVRSLLDLIRFRNAHPAFAGDFQIHNSDHSSLVMEWRKHADWARLDVDLAARRAVISHSDPAGNQTKALVHMTGIKALTFLMFMVFAMTTDSVGLIIPEIIKTFRLSLTAAGTFQYATMAGIAVAGFFLGHLADTFGRKPTIVVGLTLFAVASYLFAAGNSFLYFSILLALSGIGIGVFKTGALALIGDLSKSTTEHTSLMNTVEGFFGVGSIIGPAILARLLATGASWKGLYILAGTICVVLILIALRAQYPHRTMKASPESMDLRHTVAAMKNRYALAFSLGAFLYVATEAAVYVWMPTLLARL